MIYFESVKIHKFNQTNSHGISFKLEENICHRICSNDKNKINSIYYLLKQNKNYLNGNILIDNIDITKLDKNTLDNFYYENAAFCEKNLIFNNKISCFEYLSIVAKLAKQQKKYNFNKLFAQLNLSPKILDLKINKLNTLLITQIVVIAGLLKNCKYLIVKLDDFNLSENNILLINQWCEKISKIFKKTILIFTKTINNIMANINLDLNQYYQFNNKLIVTKNDINFNGYKLIQHKFNIFTTNFRFSYKIYLFQFLISFILMTFSIFLLTILNQEESAYNSSWLIYINDHRKGFYILGYGLFVINCLFQLLISYLWYKNTKKYLLFLSTINIHNLWISLLIPITLIINTFMIIGLSYVVNIITLNNINIEYNINIWNTSLYLDLAYIIEMILISYLLILKINNISKFYSLLINYQNIKGE